MATRVAIFLCPSDSAPAPDPTTGPTNYTFSSGDGSNGGEATKAPGMFILGPSIRVSDIWDGTSSTVAASEGLLGIPGPYAFPTGSARPNPPTRSFARVATGPLTDAGCKLAGTGWLVNKGASWWDGNHLNTLYNHRLTPNAR